MKASAWRQAVGAVLATPGKLLVLLVVLGLVAVAGMMAEERAPVPAAAPTSSSRPLDREAFDAKLRTGDVVRHEAEWYRPAASDAAPPSSARGPCLRHQVKP